MQLRAMAILRCLARARTTNQHDITLVGEERPGGKIADQRFIDRRACELEVGDLLGERQLGDRHLVLHRAGMLVGDLRLQQLTDDVLNGILALDRISDHLVIGMAHAGKLEVAHQLQDLVTLHHHAALRSGVSRRS